MKTSSKPGFEVPFVLHHDGLSWISLHSTDDAGNLLLHWITLQMEMIFNVCSIPIMAHTPSGVCIGFYVFVLESRKCFNFCWSQQQFTHSKLFHRHLLKTIFSKEFCRRCFKRISLATINCCKSYQHYGIAQLWMRLLLLLCLLIVVLYFKNPHWSTRNASLQAYLDGTFCTWKAKILCIENMRPPIFIFHSTFFPNYVPPNAN